MAPLVPRPGHGLLRCSICRLDLTASAGALVCRNRHSFDLARDGYVNLLAGGDDSAQLRHRAAFLNDGYFDAVAATIADHIRRDDQADRWCVVDAGCGTGHHLAGVVAALRAPAIGLGLDVAKAAARGAARRWPSLASAVADLRAVWPLHDASADLVLSVFAPKNFAETARVLRPGGWLGLVYPGPGHLAELVQRFGLMRQHAHKAHRYVDAVSRLIGPSTTTRLVRHIALDHRGVRDAILMGPNAHHIASTTLAAAIAPLNVTIDIAILLARKHAGA